MADIIISELQKSGDEKFIIAEREYHGHELLDCRLYYLDQKSKEYRPTSKGLALTRRRWAELLPLLNQAAAQS